MTEYREHAHTTSRIHTPSSVTHTWTGFACGGPTSTTSDLIGLSEFFDLI